MYYTAMYVYLYSDISREWKCKENFKELGERRRAPSAEPTPSPETWEFVKLCSICSNSTGYKVMPPRAFNNSGAIGRSALVASRFIVLSRIFVGWEISCGRARVLGRVDNSWDAYLMLQRHDMRWYLERKVDTEWVEYTYETCHALDCLNVIKLGLKLD